MIIFNNVAIVGIQCSSVTVVETRKLRNSLRWDCIHFRGKNMKNWEVLTVEEKHLLFSINKLSLRRLK